MRKLRITFCIKGDKEFITVTMKPEMKSTDKKL